MQWTDQGIIIGTRLHGETSLIVELMTAGHGRHMGLVRGGRSRRLRPVLQPGNRVEATWRARLDAHLGTYAIEPLEQSAARLMQSACAIGGIQLMASHLRLLPERDPHGALYDAACVLVDHLTDPALAGPLMVRFELRLLEELGFGLDLSRCAGSGATDDLAYVSPKSGRAVNRDTGAPWADRLLPLPAFLTAQRDRRCGAGDLDDAFALTGHFLDRDVWSARGIAAPDSRTAFIAATRKALVAAA
ncbi:MULTISPECIES: DNA repair protein RecO [unclassified Roseitalea]|uniref:DNA repair protein RecO n=1 Tax=unclassified Roseitalea TaxID=2639107 RepID=UPI00273F0534|nr:MULTISPECIES: DNA repair protein RecO [unclassified Roseitalea]